MSKTRTERIKEARVWWRDQHFSDGDHIIMAYRKRFNVDKVCAMRDLLKMGVLDQETKEIYRQKLLKREKRFALKRETKARRAEERKAEKLYRDTLQGGQDESFFFTAGYTSGGFPYGITREEESWTEEEEENEEMQEEDPMDDPGYLDYLESLMSEGLQDESDFPFS